jgi:hypothetical protein
MWRVATSAKLHPKGLKRSATSPTPHFPDSSFPDSPFSYSFVMLRFPHDNEVGNFPTLHSTTFTFGTMGPPL